MKKLTYGENHRQANAWLDWADASEINDPLALPNIEVVEGSTLSYINITDVDRLIHSANRLAAACHLNLGNVPLLGLAVKHGNACGAAVGSDRLQVVRNIVAGDPDAISGGAAIFNFEVDATVAEILLTYMTQKRILDLVIAPSFTREAVVRLSRKNGKCRLLRLAALDDSNDSLIYLDATRRSKQVRGGVLYQDGDPYVLPVPDEWRSKFSETELVNIILGWAIGSTSNSNSVILTKDQMLIGGGTGQRSRVMACKLALMYAHAGNHDPSDATAYSDSYFPFSDGPEVLANAGITTIFATSGSIRDEEILKSCEKLGVDLITRPDAEARGFFAH